MAVYYNEIDPQAAQWLRNLIATGRIPKGDVDDRSIEDVKTDDLRGYTQCHFFAGIGGWSVALELAGWPESRPVWTGSCPCQPFSNAGKQSGSFDDRHLWPHFLRLIEATRPVTVFGEQVASKLGRVWCAGVRSDLDLLGYAFGAADICAAGVGAPHIRQRLFWVADADDHESRGRGVAGKEKGSRREFGARPFIRGADSGMADSISERRCIGPARFEHAAYAASAGKNGWGGRYVDCADGKQRRIEPRIEPLAHGGSRRVVKLRGYGNAIVPQVAAEFIKAFDQVTGGENAPA